MSESNSDSDSVVESHTVADSTLPRSLDLGCGDNKRDPDALGVDLRAYDDVDVRQDLTQTPWQLPNGAAFPSDHFERVDAFNVLEHLPNLPAVMDEIHRVCVDGATVRGRVPHWRDRDAYIDPTHVARYVSVGPDNGESIVLPGPVTTGSDYHIRWPGRDLPFTGTVACGFDERTFDFWDSTTAYGGLQYFAAEFRVRDVGRIRRVRFWRSRPIEFELEVVK
ncbi:MAG: methyltransferase domain-containing protein [Natronomonas sp.]